MATRTLDNGPNWFRWVTDGPNQGEPIVIIALGGNDTIGGDFGDDFLYGGSENDHIVGFGGLDYLLGEAGNDSLDGDDGTGPFGTYYVDRTPRPDILDGGLGADYFKADNLDIVVYDSAGFGVRVDLIFFGANTGDAAGDTYEGVVNLRGSIFGDTLLANTAANIIDGSGGNDVIWAREGADTLRGDAGDDILYGEDHGDILQGGFGSDTAAYTFAATGVKVDLMFWGLNTGSQAAGDSYSSIENIEGSNFDDALYASDEVNVVRGLFGKDTIFGRPGNDLLYGGPGDDILFGEKDGDRLDGGDDYDFASYYYFSPGVIVDLANPSINGGEAFGDTYFSIENIEGAFDGSDSLYGNDVGNVILAHNGLSNLLVGRGGDDRLIGGTGEDRLDGGTDFTGDYMEGRGGNDVYVVDSAKDVVVEGPFGGTDRLDSYISYSIAGLPNIEDLVLYGYTDINGDGNANPNKIDANHGNNIVHGFAGGDTIYGHNGTDTLFGDTGADTLVGGLGNDDLYGGTDKDTAVFAGNRSAYTVTRNGNVVTVAGPDGVDGLAQIDRLKFDDITLPINRTTNDVNSDGKSDVLFSSPGAVFNSNYEWQINNRSLLGQGAIDLYDKSFSVQVVGDFNGDTYSDLIFRNPSTGGVWQWQLNGTGIIRQGGVDVADPTFRLLGAGDFNGDGMDDLLFRNNAGFVYEWQMDGLRNTPLPIGPLDPSWHVQGTGDFNGDSKDDILLRKVGGAASENGAFFLWQMNGNVIGLGGGGIERPPLAWKTLGIGDFDGDGKDDFAVRNVSNTADNGAVWIYLMNGKTIKAQGAAGIANASTWKLQQIGDMDGDGRDDILFRNDAGYFYSWNMNGTNIVSEGLLQGGAQHADPSFNVVKPYWELA